MVWGERGMGRKCMREDGWMGRERERERVMRRREVRGINCSPRRGR